MSNNNETAVQINIYEEDFSEEITLNLSSKELTSVPEIKNRYLCVLYLQNNKLRELPDDFFPTLPNLKWLDLRNNELLDIPQTIKNHRSLTHILLQNNKITSLPYELGTVTTLKVLQLGGNPLMYPPRDIINAGTSKILCFLQNNLVEETFEESQSNASEKASESGHSLEKFIREGRSYNSVIDGAKIQHKALSVQFNEKDTFECDDDQDEYYAKIKGKCPKLPKSRTKILKPYNQSAKYLKPLVACSKKVQEDKIKQSYFRDMALKKQKDLIAKRDKILQGRRNIELLRNWQKEYKYRQMTLSCNNDTYKLTPKVYPYDTNPEYMTLLSREDIEKDLPDKYKRKLFRKSKPTVPRKSCNDVHLAMKIKQLFENLEAIDLNRDTMSPRTEQKLLLGEIQKISEIKQKLMELSTTNTRSVTIE